MIRIALALLIAATCAAGCTPGYRIYLDGYSELNEPVSKSAPIYVMTDPNAQNPILQRQVKAKVERLLLNDEYDVVDTPDKAKYELGFHVGMRSERIVDYLLGPDMYGGFYRGRARGSRAAG